MDDLPSWEAEYRHLPGALPITRVLAAGALVAALALFAQPATDSGRADDHRVVSPACSELARLRSHGVVSGAWYRAARAACARSEGR
jgi:hypothetical protein